MDEWKEHILENVIDKFIDYRGKTPKKTTTGIPLVTAKIVKSGRILEPNEFIAEDAYDSWMTRGFPEIDDVVLTTEAPLGEVALIKDKNVALAQRIITLRGNKNAVHNPFLKYYFQSATGQNKLESRASGTTVFGIKAAVLKKIPVILPSLPEQKAIALVLSSLDDKIDLLYRQNKTLEAMAVTLFRQWFENAEYSNKISDLIDVQNGYAFKSNDFKDVGVNGVIKIKNISGNIVDIYNTDFIDYTVADKIDSRFCLDTGDVLFAMTGAKIGKMGIIPQTDRKLWLNQRVGLFKEKCEGARFLAYLQLKSEYGQDYIENTATGSAQPNISSTGIANCDFPNINEKQTVEYSKQLSLMFTKFIFNLGQIRTLEKLRDTLLPKLMSGEVRVEHET